MSKSSNALRRRNARNEEDESKNNKGKFCMKCGTVYFSQALCPNCNRKSRY